MTTKPRAGVAAFPRDAHLDPPSSQEATAARDIVRFVSVQLSRTLSWPTTRALDGWDGVDQCLEDGTVVPIGSRDERHERGAAPVRNNVALRARCAAIRRVRPGRIAPLFAGTLALSRHARSQ